MDNKVFTMVGGISRDSINQKLFAEVKGDSRFNFDFFDISVLPFFNQDIENNPPAPVADMQARIKAADGVLVITPEYNRSIPAVLKNALDWGSRPPGKNVWAGKPGAIMGASMGALGTFGAQQHLRNIMSFLNIHVMSQPEFYFNFKANIDEKGNIIDSGKSFIKTFLDAMDIWMKKFV